MSSLPPALGPITPVQVRPKGAPRSTRPQPRVSRRRRLGQILVDEGALDAGNLAKALALQVREDTRLGDILLAHDWVTQKDLMRGLSLQYGVGFSDPREAPRDRDLIRQLDAEIALKHRVVPWMRLGDLTVLATSNPEQMTQIKARLEGQLGLVLFTLVPEVTILDTIAHGHGPLLARKAEAMVPEQSSCRNWSKRPLARALPVFAIALACAVLWAPLQAVAVLTLAAVMLLTANTLFKCAVIVSHLTHRTDTFATTRDSGAITRAPMVSILVPLFKEREIAASLVRRMAKLDYPKELLDICLIVEEHDHITRAALAASDMPCWFRVIVVPPGHPQTKPRAMNYALNFARGSIVGVYDAEDAPDPAQIRKVVRRFARAPKEVVCLQGRLDYYNPRENWIARCFTIEYASWFRVFLPAIERFGLPVPLGGTTLFFRRDVLEKIGGWDAHNVTEDADLGMRLHLAGYRTEMINVTTMEEANAAAWPWVRQRSRWNKGYVMTWEVHNRKPLHVLRQLGLKRWLGFQLMFLGSILNALLAPFLWSTIVMLFGVAHPVEMLLPAQGVLFCAVLFTAGLLSTLLLSVLACRADHLRFLRPSVPIMLGYFPMATLAMLKALTETIGNPFYWDKTSHGHFGGADDSVTEAPTPAAPSAAAPLP